MGMSFKIRLLFTSLSAWDEILRCRSGFIKLAKDNPRPVTLNDINECANSLSCSIDVYDKHGLIVGQWGSCPSHLSLYLNDNHFDLITDINKFKAYTSRQTVIKHCRKCQEQCQDQRKVLCDQCRRRCRACLKEVDDLNDVGLRVKWKSFDNLTKEQREKAQKGARCIDVINKTPKMIPKLALKS